MIELFLYIVLVLGLCYWVFDTSKDRTTWLYICRGKVMYHKKKL